MAKSFNIRRVETHFRAVLQYAPAMLANDALNFFLDRFTQQNWLDHYPEAWPAKKVRDGRSLLIRRGQGRRSVRISEVTTTGSTISTDLDYMAAHNRGFKGTVNVREFTRNRYSKHKVASGKVTSKGKQRMKTVQRISGSGTVAAHTRKMNLPRRQFMGESAVLTQQLIRHLTAELMKGLR